METIGERVSKACVTLGYAMLYSDVTSPCLIAKSDAIYIVEEQDRIARQEERERCINKACEWLKSANEGIKFLRSIGSYVDGVDVEMFRKAMMEE